MNSPSTPLVAGQRWMSASEPELGLGLVVQAGGGQVTLLFPATGELRSYSRENAPIRRVIFSPGENIQTKAGVQLRVVDQEERDGVVWYYVATEWIQETELRDDWVPLSPLDRLGGGGYGTAKEFDLRKRCWEFLSAEQQHPRLGLRGVRVEDIPHQQAVVAALTQRIHPRALLSDEVGLGKTIEAGLVLHHGLLTGRFGSALIIVPDSLIHQWFVEMFRRFNLSFSIQEAGTPLVESPLVLCAASALHEDAILQALCARRYSAVMVDESHLFAADDKRDALSALEQISAGCEALLLLSATPEQLGPRGLFRQLKLLDPDRYSDFEAFLEEQKHYPIIAKKARDLMNSGEIEAG